MWISGAEVRMKSSFDAAIQSAYGFGAGDELSNLAALFSDAALDQYHLAIRAGLDPASEAFVDVAWIDKRPIAYLDPKKAGAELGDMLVIVEQHDRSGSTLRRACIFEVKMSPKANVPPVPVTPGGDSTDNQFRILCDWPTLYGLKATSGNRSFLLQNVVTRPGAGRGGVLAQAWYAAVKPTPESSLPVCEPWVVAPAICGARFNHTLGDALTACLLATPIENPKGTLTDVGRDFVEPTSAVDRPGWDHLVKEIIKVTCRYQLPPHYFGKYPGVRYRSRRTAKAGSAILLALAPAAFWHSFIGSLLAILVLLAVAMVTLRPWRSERHDAREMPEDNLFPVVFFTIRHSEPMDFGDRPVDGEDRLY